MKQENVNKFFQNYLWLICFLIGGIVSFVIMFVLPHKIYMNSFLEPTFKIGAFLLVIFGVAFIPNQTKWSRYTYLFIIVAIFAFLIYFIPRVSYYGFVGIPEKEPNCFDEFYTQLWLFLYPAIILTLCFTFRMMGGKSGECLKIAIIPIIGLFSGLLDVIWPIVNGMPLPDILYANHIRVIIGHWPSYREGVIFALCHIPLVLIVLFLPLDKWFQKVGILNQNNNVAS